MTGSSSTKKSGSPHRATAMPSRWRIPREKFLAFFLPVPLRPTRSRSSGTQEKSGRPSMRHCCFRLFSAVMSRLMEGVSMTAPMRRRERLMSGLSLFTP